MIVYKLYVFSLNPNESARSVDSRSRLRDGFNFVVCSILKVDEIAYVRLNEPIHCGGHHFHSHTIIRDKFFVFLPVTEVHKLFDSSTSTQVIYVDLIECFELVQIIVHDESRYDVLLDGRVVHTAI